MGWTINNRHALQPNITNTVLRSRRPPAAVRARSIDEPERHGSYMRDLLQGVLRPGTQAVASAVAGLIGVASLAYGGQNPNGILVPPFLEETRVAIAMTMVGDGTTDTPAFVGAADIAPHFIVGPTPNCRGTEFYKIPCISATAGLRIRMEDDDSVPIESPSFTPRLNVQWLAPTDGALLHSIGIQIGHHSNGQAGCLLSWTDAGAAAVESLAVHVITPEGVVNPAPPTPGTCADGSLFLERAIDGSVPLTLSADTDNGNFSLNYTTISYDVGSSSEASKWRGSLELDLYWGRSAPLDLSHPRFRFRGASAYGFRGGTPLCRRLDLSSSIGLVGRSRIKNDFTHEVVVQMTCLWSQERGIGTFFRVADGWDDYNSWFHWPSTRVQVGLTIGRLRFFGGLDG